jgi:hypothetical protein
MWKKPATTGWTSATGLEEYERLMWKSVQSGDWLQVNAHISPEFLGATPEGVRNRASMVEHLQQMKLTDFSLGEFESHPAGGDMVVSYVITLQGTVGGQPLPAGPMRVVTVWQTVKRGWVEIAQTIMPVTPVTSPNR